MNNDKNIRYKLWGCSSLNDDTIKCYEVSNYKLLHNNNCNCKINTNEYYNIYRRNNKDKIALKNKKYRDKNPNYNNNYYNQNKELLLEKKRIKYKMNLSV